MGAVDFQTFVQADVPLEDAYRQAVDQATYDRGHDPYNGTISTTSGVIKVAGPVDAEEARRLVRAFWEWDESWEEVDDEYVRTGTNPFAREYEARKWESALAIEVGGDHHGWLFFGLAAM